MASTQSNSGAVVLKLRGDTSQLLGELKKARGELVKVAGQSGTTARKMTGSISKANQVVFSLAAGVEDAAFGVRGFANNIPFFIQSISNLTSSVQGGASALRAIGASLLGLPGLMLAVSAASFVALGGLDQLRGMFKKTGDDATKMSSDMREAINAALEFEALDKLSVSTDNLDAYISQARARVNVARRLVEEANRPFRDIGGTAGSAAGGNLLTGSLARMAAQRGIIFGEELTQQRQLLSVRTEMLEREEAILLRLKEQKKLTEDVSRIQQSFSSSIPTPTGVQAFSPTDTVLGSGPIDVGELLKIDIHATDARLKALREVYQKGLIEPMQFLRQQASLAQSELLALAEAGDINSAAFERYSGILLESNMRLEQMKETTKGVNANLKLLQSVGMTVFQSLSSAIVDMVVEMKSAQDVAKNLFKTILSAGLSFGIRALFGGLTGGASEAAGAAGGLGFIPLPRMFATGGIVSKPTLGVVGEAGPEAVIPLSRLSSIMGQGRLVGEFVLRGEDLALSVEAGQRSLNRKYGG